MPSSCEWKVSVCLPWSALQLGEGGGEGAGSQQFYQISQVSFQITSKKCREELKSERKCVCARVCVHRHGRERVGVERAIKESESRKGTKQGLGTDRREMEVRTGKGCREGKGGMTV